jgi:hypothetical protein
VGSLVDLPAYETAKSGFIERAVFERRDQGGKGPPEIRLGCHGFFSARRGAVSSTVEQASIHTGSVAGAKDPRSGGISRDFAVVLVQRSAPAGRFNILSTTSMK